jgi:hypothetical protein
MGEAAERVKRIREDFPIELAADHSSEDVVEGFPAAIAPLATDDFVCVMDGGVLTTTYEGIDGLRRGWADFLGAFDSIAIEPQEMRETPDSECVVEFVHITGHPKGTSGEIEQDASAVWRWREDRLAAVEFHIDRASALRSAGLDP